MYKLSYELVGFLFLVILTSYFFCRPIFPNLANKLYRLILIISILSVALNVITGHTINYSTKYSINLNYFLNTFFFLISWTLPYILYDYVVVLSKNLEFRHRKSHKLLLLYFFIQSAIVLSTPFTDFIFLFDSNGIYHHGILFRPLSHINFFVLILSVFIVTIHGKKMPMSQRIIIPFYIFIIIGVNIVQIFFPLVLLNGLMLSIATFLMFLTLQNPISYFDPLTPNYSRKTFIEYLEMLIIRNKPFQIVIVDIKGTTKINKTFGENIGTEIIYKVAQKIRLSSFKNLSFRLQGDIFVIVTFSLSQRDKVLNSLESQFPFNHKYNDLMSLEADVRLNYTNTMHNFVDIDEAYQSIMSCLKVSKEKNLKLINTVTLNSIKRSRKIEIALNRAIENHDIKIYLQPILETQTNQFTNAEALVRIYDDDLGLIMPGEFIPMAEKNGTITKLTPLVIEGVCKLLSTNKFPQFFSSISLNLSVVDCININFDTIVLDLLKQYKIDPSFLIFEVTETMASIAPELKQTMVNIKKAGSRFALDDFGSGYANLDAVLQLPFDIIKIDRELLLTINDEQHRKMFFGIMNTLKALELETVIEGVETKSQSEIVKQVDGTYQQGFLYSKPLSIDDYMEFINKKGNTCN